VAALRAILKALRRAVGRDLAGSFKANNLLFLGLLGSSAEALFVLLGISVAVSAFVRSAGQDSSGAAGAVAPLGWQRLGLRLASLALSPVVWIGVLILLKTRRPGLALAFCGLALGCRARWL
jgi:hypothetical protein